jgi:membrane protein
MATQADRGGQAERGREAEAPHQIPARGWKDVLVRTVKEFKDDDIPTAAAAAAFYAWLAAAATGFGLLRGGEPHS